MKILTAAAMREADRRTIEELGLPGPVLMETAGMRVVEAILALDFNPAPVVVVAGPGNNGGDGLVVARLLRAAGVPVSLWSTVPPGGYRGDAAVNERFLRACGFPVHALWDTAHLDSFRAALVGAGLVVDALLGTGVSRPVEGAMAAVIRAVNEAPAPVLAVDIPSGVNADSGAVMGEAVRADWTVTFAFPKRGLLLHPGAGLAGRVLVGEIHVPEGAAEDEAVELITAAAVGKLLPARSPAMHKGDAGRVLVVAGSAGMGGAAVMAAEAALRGGAGLVYLAVPQSLCPGLEARLLEVITVPLPESAPGVIDPAAAGALLHRAEQGGAVAVGPGLDPGECTRRLLQELIPRCPVPLVLDAGALAALGDKPQILRQAMQTPVITPHAGEMGRLAGLTAAAVQQDRIGLARRYAREWGCVLALKGANTVIAEPGGGVYINPTGGPALATAGTGDLLTGLTASLIAQGLAPAEAARAGAFIHGLAGDLVPGERGYAARDVLAAFGEAFRRMPQLTGVTFASPYLRPLKPLV